MAAFANLFLLVILIWFCEYIRHKFEVASPSRYLMLPAGALYAIIGGVIWSIGTASAKKAISENPKASRLYWFNQIYPIFWIILILYCLWEWLFNAN